MADCILCGLPTPTPPITDTADRPFCCQGCREVHAALGELDADAHEEVTARLDNTTERGDAVDSYPDTVTEAFLNIQGMHCSSCEAFLEVRGERHEGVYAVSVNYATNLARIVYDPEQISEHELPALLSGYGYKAAVYDEARRAQPSDDNAERIIIGGFLTMLIMPWYIFFLYPSYVGIETGIFTFDMTSRMGLYFPMVFIGILSVLVLVYTGRPIFTSAYVSVLTKRPNMNLLIAVAVLAAFFYSVIALILGSTHLYFDVSVAIIMIVSLGTYYENRIKRKITRVLSDITTQRDPTVTRFTASGETEDVDSDVITPDDDLLIREGEQIPFDGTVTSGTAMVDESVITGESRPIHKAPGDAVIGGATVTTNALVITPDDPLDSTISRIATLMWNVQSGTPGPQRIVDKLATVFVPLVLILGATITVYQFARTGDSSFAVLAGLTVLVVACPCALGLATPLAIASGLRTAIENNIIVTNDSVFETIENIDTIVFDKTGTLTTGSMQVVSRLGDQDALRAATALEHFSSHPIAQAITESNTFEADGGDHLVSPDVSSNAEGTVTADESAYTVTDFTVHPGQGVRGVVNDVVTIVGSPAFLRDQYGTIPAPYQDEIETANRNNSIPILVGYDDEIAGLFIVGDTDRDDLESTLAAFRDKEVVVLTGDDSSTVSQYRESPYIDHVFAGVPPDGKVETIRRLMTTGTIAMVGDGTNDAPALAEADLGIALGDGTATAIDAADVVITDGQLSSVPRIFELVSTTRWRIRQNIGWGFLYNIVAIPIAAVGLLNPLFAALAMAASSIIVVVNSSRNLLP